MQRAVQWLCQVCSYSMGDSVVYKAPSCEGGSSDRGMWLRSLHLVRQRLMDMRSSTMPSMHAQDGAQTVRHG